MKLKKIFKNFICDWFHGGGDVKRDPQNRINWQCRKCGRWSSQPVELETENRIINSHINSSKL